MDDSHYSRFDGSDLILRDELAIDRTLLANERTLLAYLRAGVTLVLAGLARRQQERQRIPQRGIVIDNINAWLVHWQLSASPEV